MASRVEIRSGHPKRLRGPIALGSTPTPGVRPPSPVVLARTAVVEEPPPAQATGWNFDWDDNIFLMPTKLHLFHKETGEEIRISSADYAIEREQIGKGGRFQDYEARPDSHANFGDPADGRNYFLEDVKRALASGDNWRAPSWDAFAQALSSPSTARMTTIITARHHARETIHQALRFLQGLGLIRCVPPIENIYAVNHPDVSKELGGGNMSTSEAKTLVMKRCLDAIDEMPFGRDARPVVPPEGGDNARPMHLWGFSDDDFSNYKSAVDALGAEIRKGRWPNVKVTMFFTGKNHPTERPRAEILTPDGRTRPASPQERLESEAIMRTSEATALTTSAP